MGLSRASHQVSAYGVLPPTLSSARRAPLLDPGLVSNWEDRWPGKILRPPPRPRILPDRSRLVSGPTDSLLPKISRSFGKLGGAAQLRKHNIQKVNAAQARCFLS
jgi:hypothetical protein